jgi:hypothetical protein
MRVNQLSVVANIDERGDGLRKVIGGWLEMVSEREWCAFLDEEGKLKGLPANEPATLLAHSLGWRMGDFLVGTVMFLGPVDEEGESTPVPDVVLDMASELGLWLPSP